ncbi:MAG: hypothetical protein ACRC20_05410 [Segniliparus sp.]|uniref:hypothetical protein n=1 Tax=Segniliparus sp. TaxID=2804064 RepID=UPI003F32D65D
MAHGYLVLLSSGEPHCHSQNEGHADWRPSFQLFELRKQAKTPNLLVTESPKSTPRHKDATVPPRPRQKLLLPDTLRRTSTATSALLEILLDA